MHPPLLLGRKSLNVNLSDIAAMGCVPRFAMLGLGLPAGIGPGWIRDFFSGLKSAAEQAGVTLIGGDVSRAGKITISVTVAGEGKSYIRRSTARPGDLCYVSGTLGNARQGLLLVRKGRKPGRNRKESFLIKSFLDPYPQLALGRELCRLEAASSMIDISDGLSVDLGHICRESRCGVVIEKARLPISPELRHFQRDPCRFALHGGEDYELLFTVPPQKKDVLLRLQKNFRLTEIGRITEDKGLFLVDKRGKKKRMDVKGYEHFGQTAARIRPA